MIGKALVIVGAIALALTVYQHTRQAQPDLRELWSSWKAQYGVNYADAAEDEYRLSVFTQHYLTIQEHNAKGLSWRLGINQFSNLTPQEFKDIYASGLPVDPNAPEDPYCPSAVNCPSFPATNLTSQNWTAKGAVTPIKNQLQCGSCWAFSTTGSLEGLDFIANGTLNSYSEQQLVDCASNCEGCDGCWPYLAMEYAAANGLEFESQYPYTGQDGKCKFNKADAHSTNTGYKCVPQKSVADMEGAATFQPVSVAVQADQAAWQSYAGGVVSGNCGDTLDHAVLVVGWGEIQGKSAWIVKNSWGATWGENGYIWIDQEATANQGYGVCGILRCGTVPTW